jgi:uncharacterized HAD superfamily protein
MKTINLRSNILIGLGILVVVITAGILFNSYKQRRDANETILRTESEMRFKQLVKEMVDRDQKIDSIASVIAQKQAVIDYLEKNPQVIIQNNDSKHFDIDKLNAYNSIVLFTNGATNYEASRERYSLHRFSKHN